MSICKKYIIFSIILSLLFVLSSCNINKGVPNDNEIVNTTNNTSEEETNNSTSENTKKTANLVAWAEITKEGVDEELLIKNIDEEKLKFVAERIQQLTKIINEKGEKDKSYWSTAKWYADVVESEQYKSVIDMGTDAMKPLYLIIHKSKDAYLYEYICAMALDELSGFDFSKKNNGNGWTNSKEFLQFFNEATIEKKGK